MHALAVRAAEDPNEHEDRLNWHMLFKI